MAEFQGGHFIYEMKQIEDQGLYAFMAMANSVFTTLQSAYADSFTGEIEFVRQGKFLTAKISYSIEE